MRRQLIRVTNPIFYNLIDEAKKIGAIDNAGNGEVWLSMTRGAGESANLHLEIATAQSFWQKVLQGTLLEDFFNDCIKNIITLFKTSFLPFGSTAIPVIQQQKLLISFLTVMAVSAACHRAICFSIADGRQAAARLLHQVA